MNSLAAARAAKRLRAAGYWLVSLTWGGLMTLAGALIALGMLLSGHAPKKLGPNLYFEVGRGWGGMEYGAFFFVAKDAGESTRLHEAGHGIQNLILGPLMPFVVCIPSAVRYWMRRFGSERGKRAFSALLCLLLAGMGGAIAGGTAAMGLAGAAWLMLAVGALLVLYAAVLGVWLLYFEIPKYRAGAYVPYDSVWFEASATRLGEKYYGKK